MDVVTVKANHINSFLQYQQQTLQYQLDSKLIAFYTILTVALSVILLSFKQSRTLLTHTAPIITQYPFVFNNNLKKCFKCLKCKLNGVDRYQILNLRTSLRNKRNNLAYYSKYCLSCCTQNNIKYLKLKRLRNIAAASLAVTKFTCNNYLFKPINTTLLKMKKTTFRLKKKFSKTNGQSYALRKCDVNSYSASDMYVANKNAVLDTNNNNNSDDNDSGYDDSTTKTTTKFLNTCQSYPVFNNHVHNNNNSEINNQETGSLRRSKSLPKINSRVRLYKKLPLRTMSRAWGNLNSIELPVWFRKPCYSFYSWVFNCNLEEMEIEDLRHYKNLSEFFRRTLKPNARIIEQECCLASPCDGKILHFGKVEKGYLEQVKGVNYSLKAFLGEQTWPKFANDDDDTSSLNDSLSDDENHHEIYEKSILYNKKNCLYHCVIYLAPGDYHRFHSPTDWEIFYRRHFPGELFSVNPSVARWLQGLFNLNERVVYYGKWKYGFFSMAPVGATNVGSIRVYMDPDLTTNNKNSSTFEKDLEKSFCSTKFSASEDNLPSNGVQIKRGEDFGEFNLGSTIVLVFEAPEDFEFNISQNQKVLYGSKLGASAKTLLSSSQ